MIVEKSNIRPSPAVDAIELWHLPYDAASDLQQLAQQTLAPDELERAARYKVEHARHAFMYYRLAMRACLASYAGVHPRDVPLGVGEFGKPFWVHPVNGVRLEFNLSHTSSCGLLAVSNQGTVGIDIECIDPRVDYSSLAREVLSPVELSEFALVPPSAQPAYVLRAWTCKEAFLKAKAIGLAVLLRDVTIKVDPHGEFLIEFTGELSDNGSPWRLKSCSPKSGSNAVLADESALNTNCFAAVAYRGAVRRLQEIDAAPVLRRLFHHPP